MVCIWALSECRGRKVPGAVAGHQGIGSDKESDFVVEKAGAGGGRRDRNPHQEHLNLLFPEGGAGHEDEEVTCMSVMALFIGVGCILTVPVLKMHTGLPPYFGMLFALGLMWIITDVTGIRPPDADKRDEHGPPQSGVVEALHKVDLAGLFFFAGVLQSVAALDASNILRGYAASLHASFGNSPVMISIILGLSSSVVDNVPLVEAAIDMFDGVGVDDPLWQLIALAAGTGGSLLSTGGIAGVTFMSMEGVSFMWYVRNVTCWALVGFVSGIAAYQLQRFIIA